MSATTDAMRKLSKRSTKELAAAFTKATGRSADGLTRDTLIKELAVLPPAEPAPKQPKQPKSKRIRGAAAKDAADAAASSVEPAVAQTEPVGDPASGSEDGQEPQTNTGDAGTSEAPPASDHIPEPTDAAPAPEATEKTEDTTMHKTNFKKGKGAKATKAHRPPRAKTAKGGKARATPKTPKAPKERKPRAIPDGIPPVGGTFTRAYKGKDCKITVTEAGFRWEGTEYPSLTALALAITGAKAISGPAFFGVWKPKA